MGPNSRHVMIVKLQVVCCPPSYLLLSDAETDSEGRK